MDKIERINGTSITTEQVKHELGMQLNSSGIWVPTEASPNVVHHYLASVQKPTRNGETSRNRYKDALKSLKFAKYICANDGELAIKLGIAKEISE